VFAGLINQAKSAASHLVLKYVARASVAVPFVIATGFAIAAITVMLVERFGHVTAYWLVAGGLAAMGFIASIVVSAREHGEEAAEQQAAKSDNRVHRQSGRALVGGNGKWLPSREKNAHPTEECKCKRLAA
jgi:hypothetical protein